MTDPLLHRVDAVSSTMDLAHRLAEQGAAAGTAVVAAEQTMGRGSRGRAWHSGRGGLWLSLLVRPSAAGAELLSLRAGLALAGSLESADAGLRVALKWPNDLFWENRKLGGILCEVRWVGDAPAWAAVGIGLNVRNRVPDELAPTTASLGERWPAAQPDQILDLVLPRLRALDVARERLTQSELAELAARDWLRGRRLAAPVAGVASGIAADGALLVRDTSGAVTPLRSGGVTIAEPAGRL